MLKYSVNNQTFYRSKIESHKWLGKKNSIGPFYVSEYDPQFNIEGVREILDEDEEVDNV